MEARTESPTKPGDLGPVVAVSGDGSPGCLLLGVAFILFWFWQLWLFAQRATGFVWLLGAASLVVCLSIASAIFSA